MNEKVKEFLDFLTTEKGASSHTTKNYGIDLREFINFFRERELEKITYLDVRSFLAFLKSRQYSKSSISRKLACIRSFFKYLADIAIPKATGAP